MMRSTYNNNNIDDDDDFAPNPFRSGGGNTIHNNNNNLNQQQQGTTTLDFFETPNNNINDTQQQQQQQQPDPNTGMVGTIHIIEPVSQQQQQYNDMYHASQQREMLTGTMDQMGVVVNNKASSTNNNNTNNNNSMIYTFFTKRCCIPYETIVTLFDIDTIDIYIRMKATILYFHQPNYFRLQILGIRMKTSSSSNNNNDITEQHQYNSESDSSSSHHHYKGPDLYGPIWISMTCMFLLGITANMNDYYRHVQQQKTNHSDTNDNENETTTIDQEFEYDLTHLLNAMYVCFLYTFGISTFFWLICICMGLNNGQHHYHYQNNNNMNNNSNSQFYLSWMYWVCHYGYSLIPIIIGTCFAWILHYTLYHWIVLGISTFISSLFIIRNMSTPLMEQEIVTAAGGNTGNNDPTNSTFPIPTTTTTSTHAKAAPILLSILGVHFTFLLVLKLTFYP